jgi:hypothetical protein
LILEPNDVAEQQPIATITVAATRATKNATASFTEVLPTVLTVLLMTE